MWNGERREIQHIPKGHGGELQESVQRAFIEFLLCKNVRSLPQAAPHSLGTLDMDMQKPANTLGEIKRITPAVSQARRWDKRNPWVSLRI